MLIVSSWVDKPNTPYIALAINATTFSATRFLLNVVIIRRTASGILDIIL